MYIKKLHLTNIRSFEEKNTINFSKGINVIIGKNNSGKSTILKPICHLQDLVKIDKWDIRVGKTECRVEFEFDFTEQEFINYFKYLQPKNFKINKDDVLKSLKNNNLYFIVNKNETSQLSINSLLSDPHGTRHTIKLEPFTKIKPDNFIYTFLSKRKTTNILTIINKRYTDQVDINFNYLISKIDDIVSKFGTQLSKTFHSLCKDILNLEISTSQIEDNKKEAGLYNEKYKEIISLNSMGEGTSHILAMIVDLCEAKEKLFIIEEPENDLHPKALKKLLGLIQDKSINNQFIITIHSNIVVKYLGMVDESKLFNLTMHINEDNIPTSIIEEIKEPGKRLNALEELGYELLDYDLYKGWLFLEESSAEEIIRDYLIEWFTPSLKYKLRTSAAKGNSTVSPKFENFLELFVFVHLESIYKNKAWVILDGDPVSINYINELKSKFKKWTPEHFKNFSKRDFEYYYPSVFKEDFKRIQDIEKKEDAFVEKQKLTKNVVNWIKEDKERAQAEFAVSAKEVISILKDIEKVLSTNQT